MYCFLCTWPSQTGAARKAACQGWGHAFVTSSLSAEKPYLIGALGDVISMGSGRSAARALAFCRPLSAVLRVYRGTLGIGVDQRR